MWLLILKLWKKELVIVIDRNAEEEKRIKELLQSKRYVAAINMHSIYPQFQKIKKVMENYDFVKYLYGGGDKFYLETVSKFRLKKRGNNLHGGAV